MPRTQSFASSGFSGLDEILDSCQLSDNTASSTDLGRALSGISGNEKERTTLLMDLKSNVKFYNLTKSAGVNFYETSMHDGSTNFGVKNVGKYAIYVAVMPSNDCVLKDRSLLFSAEKGVSYPKPFVLQPNEEEVVCISNAKKSIFLTAYHGSEDLRILNRSYPVGDFGRDFRESFRNELGKSGNHSKYLSILGEGEIWKCFLGNMQEMKILLEV